MSRRDRIRRIGVLVLAAVGLPAVTVAAARPAGGTERGGVFRLGSVTDYGTLDPALAYSVPTWVLEYATCAKLFNYPDEPGAAGARAMPEVVQHYSISKDRRTYTFDLKRTFRFQTGAPVTAASFAGALDRDADPKLGSPAVAYMHEIAGADAVIAGKVRTISGVRTLGPYRLRIRLTRALNDFTVRLAMPFFCPVPPGTPRHELELPPGSGPYYVAEHVARRRIVLHRNPYYRGDRPAHLDEVDWRLDLPAQDCVAATERGEVDRCEIPETAAVHAALAKKYGVNRPGGRYFVGPQLGTYYLAFNHDRKAFAGAGQIPLAKAINYALDREALMSERGATFGTLTDRMLPPVLGREGRLYPLRGGNVAAARTWLGRASYKPQKLVLYVWNNSFGVHVGQVLIEDLRRIGIDLEVKYFSAGKLWQKVTTRGEPFDIVLSEWAADYPDPVAFFRPLLGEPLRETGNTNLGYVESPRLNAAIDAADRLSGDVRRKAFARLDVGLMRDDPPWAPLVHPNFSSFVSSSVGCFFTHPVVSLDITAVCKHEPQP